MPMVPAETGDMGVTLVPSPGVTTGCCCCCDGLTLIAGAVGFAAVEAAVTDFAGDLGVFVTAAVRAGLVLGIQSGSSSGGGSNSFSNVIGSALAFGADLLGETGVPLALPATAGLLVPLTVAGLEDLLGEMGMEAVV
jgi:hypothetical protein